VCHVLLLQYDAKWCCEFMSGILGCYAAMAGVTKLSGFGG
jgi:hypothetical protein